MLRQSDSICMYYIPEPNLIHFFNLQEKYVDVDTFYVHTCVLR
jgi:hypothetical protein